MGGAVGARRDRRCDAIELAAAFEEDMLVVDREGDFSESGEAAKGNDEDDDGDDEYVDEKLIDRRMNCGTGRYEYLVQWGGFPPEEDTWEPAEGLPADIRSAFDATMRSSSRSRARTVA